MRTGKEKAPHNRGRWGKSLRNRSSSHAILSQEQSNKPERIRLFQLERFSFSQYLFRNLCLPLLQERQVFNFFTQFVGKHFRNFISNRVPTQAFGANDK